MPSSLHSLDAVHEVEQLLDAVFALVVALRDLLLAVVEVVLGLLAGFFLALCVQHTPEVNIDIS